MVHFKAASRWVHVVISLYWPPLKKELSHLNSIIRWLVINQWLIWHCVNLKKLLKGLPKWTYMLEKHAFPHTYLYSGTRMKCLGIKLETQHFTILNSKMLSKVHSCSSWHRSFSKYICNLRKDYNLTLQNLFNDHNS